jgi:uroporphyrinogen-III synthase
VKLLIIRPQPGADATADRVRAAGHEPLLMPLFAAETVDWEIPGEIEYDGLLITSANAIRHAGDKRSAFEHLPVFAVGQNSAEAARSFGFQIEYTGLSGVNQLLADIDARNLLWLAGEDRTEFKKPDDMQICCRIVYRSAALPIPQYFSEVLLSADHVLLHSPRAARHFAALAAQQAIKKESISIAALSEKIALAAGSGWAKVCVASMPSDDALLSLL